MNSRKMTRSVLSLVLCLFFAFCACVVPVSAASKYSLSTNSLTIRDGEKATIIIKGAKSGAKWTYDVSNPNIIQTESSGNKLYILGLHNSSNEPKNSNDINVRLASMEIPDDSSDAQKVILGSMKMTGAKNLAENRVQENKTAIQSNSTVITIHIGDQDLTCTVAVVQELRKSDFNYTGDNRIDAYNCTNYIDRVNTTGHEDSVFYYSEYNKIKFAPRQCDLNTSANSIQKAFGKRKIVDYDDEYFDGSYYAETKITYSYFDNSSSRMFYLTFILGDDARCVAIRFSCEGVI